MTRKGTIQVESIAAGVGRFKTARETGEPQGEFITFETLESMLKTLTAKRWELVSILQAQGPMKVRALARRLGRDVSNVHADVIALKEIGLVEDHDAGIWVPYEEIEAHIRFTNVSIGKKETQKVLLWGRQEGLVAQTIFFI